MTLSPPFSPGKHELLSPSHCQQKQFQSKNNEAISKVNNSNNIIQFSSPTESLNHSLNSDIDDIIDTCTDSHANNVNELTMKSPKQQQSSKLALKFKHSVSTNWIPSIRKKNTSVEPLSLNLFDNGIKTEEFRNKIDSHRVNTENNNTNSIDINSIDNIDNKQLHQKTGFFPKASKRISLAPASLIPKRFSSHQFSITSNNHDENFYNNNTIIDDEFSNNNSDDELNERLQKNSSSPTITNKKNKRVHSKSTNSNKSMNPIPAQPLSPNRSISNTPSILIQSSPTTSILQSGQHRQVLNRNSSFSSSITHSEKSTLGKSLNAFKRTTKSILFLESNTNSSNSPISTSFNNISNNNGSNDFIDDHFLSINPDDLMTIIRRSKSYTEADRREALSFALLEDLPEVRKRQILPDSEELYYSSNSYNNFDENSDRDGDKIDTNSNEDNYISSKNYNNNEINELYNTDNNKVNNKNLGRDNNDITFDESEILKNDSNFMNKEKQNNINKNRYRSKTIDVSDNPLLELTSNTNSGLLSSIANFVKINRNLSSAPSNSKLNENIQDSPKLNHLETIENESPSDFLARLLKIYPITCICELLSSEDNDFLKETLQEYLSAFYDFKNEPLDIALRKFLMLNYLPKETQQIDRFIYQFAKFYFSQHPELGFDQDTVYILTYSLIMVHTDKFNPNNKKKMTRFEFIENVLSALENNLTELASNPNELSNLILKELLGYFFDNITYCPLIKISPEQSTFALEALKTKNFPLPYPNLSFLNSSSMGKNSEYDYRKSSVSSSAVSIPSSSNSIHRSTSQQVLQGQIPLKKKSTSFLWNSPSTIDPYEYIVKNENDSLNELKLLSNEKDINLNCCNPFILPDQTTVFDILEDELPNVEMINEQLNKYSAQLDEDIDSEFLYKIWKSLTQCHIEFTLKLPKKKGSYLISEKVTVVPLNESNGEEYYLTRVIKVGLIDRQEISTSSNETNMVPTVKPDLTDMSTMDDIRKTQNASKTQSTNKNRNTVWKRYFCILTVVGMFFFNDVSSFRMRFCGKNETDGTKMVIIEESPKSKLINSFSEAFDVASHNIQSTVNTMNTDASSFITFPHFRTEKNEKLEKEDVDVIKPSFVLGTRTFATRKLQNIEYDATVNESTLSQDMSPSPSGLSDCSVFISSSNKISSKNLNNTINSSPALQSQNNSYDDKRFNMTSDSMTNSDAKKSSKNNLVKSSFKYTFFIYDKMSKNIYMVSSLSELKSWIHSINIMSVLSCVKINSTPLDYHIVPKEIGLNKNNENIESKYYEILPLFDSNNDQYSTNVNLSELADFIKSTTKMSDLYNDKFNEEIKNEKVRNRSNTTLLSKITPSIPNLGLGLSSSSSKNENSKKLKTNSFDGSSDIISSTSNNDIEHVTLNSKTILSSDDNKRHDKDDTGLIEEVTDLGEQISHNLKLVKEISETAVEKEMGTTLEDVSARKISTHNSANSMVLHSQLLEHLYGVKRLLLTMPLQKKTKEDLLSAAKILGIKLEWLWFEKCRSLSMLVISKKIMQLNILSQTDEKLGKKSIK